jgi:hypothetical protein
MIINGRLSKQQRLAIQFFADKLLTKQIQPYIMVEVAFTQKFDIAGEIEITDYNMRGIPRCFKFHINRKIGSEEILRTIAHEMVHVKQYCKRELNEEMNRWMNEKVDTDEIPYHDRPWEIEAHQVGDNLYEEFICQNVATKNVIKAEPALIENRLI